MELKPPQKEPSSPATWTSDRALFMLLSTLQHSVGTDICSLLSGPCLRVHQLLHHQVYVNDGTEVEGPVKKAVAHKLWDKRPHQGKGESQIEHLAQVDPRLLWQSPAKNKMVQISWNASIFFFSNFLFLGRWLGPLCFEHVLFGT